ncbi:hypothetical protein D3C85_1210100 [compost metagenome]
MKTWTKILPFLVVEWLAKKHLERFTDWHAKGENRVFVYPYKGVKLFIGGDV